MAHTVRPGKLMALGLLLPLYIEWFPWSAAVWCEIIWIVSSGLLLLLLKEAP